MWLPAPGAGPSFNPPEGNVTTKRAFEWLAVTALLLGILAFSQPLSAQQSVVTDDEVNDVAGELYCPVCENTPLDVCPTQACADWRAVIRTQLSEGRSKQEIKDYFANQYGDRVLAEPPQEGFDLIVWLLPIGAVVIGGFFFVRYMRTLQRQRYVSTVGSSPVISTNGARPVAKDDYLSRIEQELQSD